MSGCGGELTEKPSIVILHGFGGTALGSAKANNYNFEDIADAEGVELIYPVGLKRSWGLGDDGDSDNSPNDIVFFSALLDHIIAKMNVNKKRIFFVGLSRGAQAIFHLANKMNERIVGIAPVCMLLPKELSEQSALLPPMPMVLINGTMDRLVKYNGGPIRLLFKKFGRVIPTKETIETWRQRNKCQDYEPTVECRDQYNDGTSIERTAWREGTNHAVVHYKVIDGGHRWPNAKPNWPLRLFVGKSTQEIDFAKEIWAVFSSIKT